jgi:hypothetical protein
MAAWILTAGLANLRTQVDARFPNRDRTSDGTIGDVAHQARVSGHNPDDTPGSKATWNGDPDAQPEVRAWDMDSDLGEAGATAQQVVDHVRALPGLSGVLRFMIYNHLIYHMRNGFAPVTYTGSSPHTEHIHFEGAWSQAADSNTTFDYRLDEVNMPTVDEIAQGVANKLYADLSNPKSGLAKVIAAARAALIGAVGTAAAVREAALVATLKSGPPLTAAEIQAAVAAGVRDGLAGRTP